MAPAIALGLVAIVWIIFGRTLGFGFINYDDSFYVYQNPFISDGLTQAGLIRAFTHSLVGNWHPVTSLSLMLDAQIFGLNAGGYHFVNVLLHTMAVLLLFFVLREMTGALWRCAFVAALFAIHPLRAESVVWISERKDVLSAVFFFLCLWAYQRYTKKLPAWSTYLLVLVTYTLGLMSKAMLVTVPFLFLLLDYWPLGRFSFSPSTSDRQLFARRTTKWLLLEKVPLLLLAAAISAATVLSQEPARKAAENWPLIWRVNNALVAVWIYFREMVWPADLALFYPHPKGTLSFWVVLASAIALLLVTAGVIALRKKAPYLLTGWFWYLGMLVPVIGLLQVGWQGHADRYTYLPQVGLYLILAFGLADLTAGWRRRSVPLACSALVILALLMTLAWRQVGYWSSSVTMWRHTLAVTTNNDVAERGLGTELLRLGYIDEAIAHDRAALRIRPGDSNGLTNLANALLQKKEYPEAIANYREVLRVRPNDAEMHRNLGKALYRSGALEEGIAEFRRALRLRPGDSDAAYSLGNALLERGDLTAAIGYFRKAIASDPKNLAAHYNLAIALQRNDELDAAVAEFRRTLQLDPGHLEARNNLAIALLKQGQPEAAIEQWKSALQEAPGDAGMHNNLAVAYLGQGRVAEAVAEWRATLRLDPGRAGTELSLAWILATAPNDGIRNGNEALALARRAIETSAARNLMAERVLAAALAETGHFAEAIATAEQGAAGAAEAQQPAVADLLQGDLQLYRQNVPLRDPTYGRGEKASSE